VLLLPGNQTKPIFAHVAVIKIEHFFHQLTPNFHLLPVIQIKSVLIVSKYFKEVKK